MSSITITTIQTDLVWEKKAANLQVLERKINELEEKTEIIVLPEMFSTGFSMRPQVLGETMEGETIEWMKNMAARNKIILTGSLIIQEADRYFNRLVWMLPLYCRNQAPRCIRERVENKFANLLRPEIPGMGQE